MSQVLVDSNVLLDVLTDDPTWFEWSALALERAAARSQPCINVLIYAEVSIGFARVEAMEEVLSATEFTRLPIPWDAAFLAGKAFLRYRRAGGERRSPLPDFLIGAHATVAGIPLLTRDTRRYRSYFPKLELISPD
jgi:hypothetical protein